MGDMYMGANGVLDHKQVMLLALELDKLSDGQKHIPYSMGEICAKLEEPMGRSLSDTSVRKYCKSGGYSWKRGNAGRVKRHERVPQLAAVLERLCVALGYDNNEDMELLKEIRQKVGGFRGCD